MTSARCWWPPPDPQHVRGRRRRRPLVLSLAGVVVISAVVAVVVAASGERSLDPVAEARAALAPLGEIVYMKITAVGELLTACERDEVAADGAPDARARAW